MVDILNESVVKVDSSLLLGEHPELPASFKEDLDEFRAKDPNEVLNAHFVDGHDKSRLIRVILIGATVAAAAGVAGVVIPRVFRMIKLPK